eukprot:gene11936-biopygen372
MWHRRRHFREKWGKGEEAAPQAPQKRTGEEGMGKCKCGAAGAARARTVKHGILSALHVSFYLNLSPTS